MRVWMSLISVLLFTAGEILAQSDRASITGTVEDSSGSVVSGARVIAINAGDNIPINATTNAMGVYTLLNLPVGRYNLTYSKDGFKKYERSDVNLAISQVAEIDVVLMVGSGGETVTVTKDATILQTQTSSISTNLGNAAISELPLNVQGGRNLAA